MKKEEKEEVRNVPNALSIFRVIISPILILLVYNNYNLFIVAALFVIAALTDFADGFIARKFHKVTNFGRRADMIADRVLMISLVVALFVYAIKNKSITKFDFELIAVLMTREVFSSIFLIIALFKKNSRPLPHARFAGKLTTTLQGISLPIIIFGWKIAMVAAVITAVSGLVCAGYYAYDSIINPKNKFQVKMDRYYEKLNG